MNALNLFAAGLPLKPEQLQQADLGNDEPFAAAADNQPGNDGQGERDFYLDRCAATRPAGEIDHAADFFDVGLHYVHPDAAAGYAGHLFGCREARQKDQIDGLTFAQPLRLFRPQQTFFNGLLLHSGGIDSAAVVADFDVDLAPFVVGAQQQPALGGFAVAQASSM